MQTCHVEVEGVVTRHSPAEALAAPRNSRRMPIVEWLSVSVSSHPLIVPVAEGK
jgi:hypothetical protein